VKLELVISKEQIQTYFFIINTRGGVLKTKKLILPVHEQLIKKKKLNSLRVKLFFHYNIIILLKLYDVRLINFYLFFTVKLLI